MKQKISILSYLTCLSIVFAIPFSKAWLPFSMGEEEEVCDDEWNGEMTTVLWSYLLDPEHEFQEENFQKIKEEIKKRSIKISKKQLKHIKKAAQSKSKEVFYKTYNINTKLSVRKAVTEAIRKLQRPYFVFQENLFSSFSVCY